MGAGGGGPGHGQEASPPAHTHKDASPLPAVAVPHASTPTHRAHPPTHPPIHPQCPRHAHHSPRYTSPDAPSPSFCPSSSSSGATTGSPGAGAGGPGHTGLPATLNQARRGSAAASWSSCGAGAGIYIHDWIRKW